MPLGMCVRRRVRTGSTGGYTVVSAVVGRNGDHLTATGWGWWQLPLVDDDYAAPAAEIADKTAMTIPFVSVLLLAQGICAYTYPSLLKCPSCPSSC